MDRRLIAIQENMECCKMYLEPDGTLALNLNHQTIKGLTVRDLKAAKTLIEDVLWMRGKYISIPEKEE